MLPRSQIKTFLGRPKLTNSIIVHQLVNEPPWVIKAVKYAKVFVEKFTLVMVGYRGTPQGKRSLQLLL